MRKEDLPLTMNAQDIADYVGCSKRIAYEMMKESDFPVVKIGKLKKVNRESFFKWWERRENKEVS